MVQILKPQMRNYQADQTDAVAMEQVAQNIGELGQVGQGVANIASAYQKGVDRRTKEAEQADQNIINTEIGDQGSYELTRFNVENISKGVDVSAPGYNTQLEEYATKTFAPYVEQMTTESGKNKILEMQRKAVDAVKKANLGSVAKLQKAAQAKKAAEKLSENMKAEAFEFGRIGDFDSFVETNADNRDSLVKYYVAQGEPTELAEAKVDLAVAENYLLGLAESEPESVLQMVYMQEKGAELAGLTGSVYDIAKTAYTKGLQAEKQQLIQESKAFNKDTPNYKAYEKRIKEIDEKIAAPEKEVEQMVRSQLAKKVVPVAQASLKKRQAEIQKNTHDGVLGLYATTLSPDIRESTDAGIEIKQVDQTAALERVGFRDLSQYNKMNNAYEAFKKSQEDMSKKPPKFDTTFVATEQAVKGLQKLFETDGRTDVQVLEDAFKFLADAGNMGVSDDQYQKIQNVVYAGVRDKVWGGEIANVINNSDRYHPDLSFFETYWAQDAKDDGLVAGYKYMSKTSKDSVKKFMNVELEKVYTTSLGLIDEALRLPDNKKQQAFDEITKFIVDRKKDIFGKAVSDFGINLNTLREERNTKGYAYTRIGFRTVEYKGDLDDGTPIFDDVDNSAEIKLARERLLNQLGKGNKKDE
jgi:hypothetical protein